MINTLAYILTEVKPESEYDSEMIQYTKCRKRSGSESYDEYEKTSDYDSLSNPAKSNRPRRRRTQFTQVSLNLNFYLNQAMIN